MATYSLQSIDENAFDQFVQSPTEAQLACVVEQLKSHSYDSKPVWKKSEKDWAVAHLAATDWYADLAEDEMLAWEDSIRTVIELPEFDSKGHGVHCAVTTDFVEIASKAYEARSQDAVARNFYPFRYFGGYHSELEEWDRSYFPYHALLTSDQVKQFVNEVSDYDSIMRDAFPDSPDRIDSFREIIDGDLAEAMEPLSTMASTGRMWYAVLDC